MAVSDTAVLGRPVFADDASLCVEIEGYGLTFAKHLLFLLLQGHQRARLDGDEFWLAQNFGQVALFAIDQAGLFTRQSF